MIQIPEWSEVPAVKAATSKELCELWCERFKIPWDDFKDLWGKSMFFPPANIYRPMQRALRDGRNVTRMTVERSDDGDYTMRLQSGMATIAGDRPTIEELGSAKYDEPSESHLCDFASKLYRKTRTDPMTRHGDFPGAALIMAKQDIALGWYQTLRNWSVVLARRSRTIYLYTEFPDGESLIIGAISRGDALWLAGKPESEIPPVEVEGMLYPEGPFGPLRADLGPYEDKPLPEEDNLYDVRDGARRFAENENVPWSVLAPVWESSHGLPREWVIDVVRDAYRQGAQFVWFYSLDGGADLGEEHMHDYWVQSAIGKSDQPDPTPDEPGEIDWSDVSAPVPWDFGNKMRESIGLGIFADYPDFEENASLLIEEDSRREIVSIIREWNDRQDSETPYPLYVHILHEDVCYGGILLDKDGCQILLDDQMGD